MSRHSGFVRLRHMSESAREAVALVNGKTRRDLDNTRLLQLGLTRLVETSARLRHEFRRECRTSIRPFPGRMW